MLTSLLTIGCYLTVGFLEVLSLKRTGDLKKIVLFLALLSASMVVSLLLTLGVQLPSPSDPIEAAVAAILSLFKGGK